MLTEVNQTQFTVKVAGRTIQSNIPSRQLAEAYVLTLPQDQRAVAEIVPVTSEGKTILFG